MPCGTASVTQVNLSYLILGGGIKHVQTHITNEKELNILEYEHILTIINSSLGNFVSHWQDVVQLFIYLLLDASMGSEPGNMEPPRV